MKHQKLRSVMVWLNSNQATSWNKSWKLCFAYLSKLFCGWNCNWINAALKCCDFDQKPFDKTRDNDFVHNLFLRSLSVATGLNYERKCLWKPYRARYRKHQQLSSLALTTKLKLFSIAISNKALLMAVGIPFRARQFAVPTARRWRRRRRRHNFQ